MPHRGNDARPRPRGPTDSLEMRRATCRFPDSIAQSQTFAVADDDLQRHAASARNADRAKTTPFGFVTLIRRQIKALCPSCGTPSSTTPPEKGTFPQSRMRPKRHRKAGRVCTTAVDAFQGGSRLVSRRRSSMRILAAWRIEANASSRQLSICRRSYGWPGAGPAPFV